MSERRVRVRFAPSPTGALHMGGVRTALFNYLFARQHGGDFLLRIEDTDSNRFVPGAEEYIIESLKWCGIQIDEGVSVGGPHAPYRQSERKDLYKKYADQLIASGNAYIAFDSAEALEQLRNSYEAEGKTFTYNYEVREQLATSLALSAEEVEQKIAAGEQYVVRFKMPENKEVVMHDLIRGEVVVNTSTLDDKVLYKSADLLPTYHLANIVDDYLMDISHVIRGEEWLPSLPLHVLLYRAFGWEDKMPQFAHLPLLLKPSGKGKLSKRDGDKLGFPVFPLFWTDPKTGETASGYREAGYLPEAFVNLLALLGWNPGNNQELFTIEELIPLFSLERVSKSGARFDPEKAKWFNQQHIQRLSVEELTPMVQAELAKLNVNAASEFVAKVTSTVKDRLVFAKDIWEQASFFFDAPTSYDEKVAAKFWSEDMVKATEDVAQILTSIAEFDTHTIETAIKEYIHNSGLKMGQVMNTLRLLLVGASKGPGIADIIAIVGREEAISRIVNGKNALSK
ncbi:glutamate--tRNA ligase [Alistipes sp. ZOR0009]|uniref:glutamate--tRNA ligase n=1 Tax=Alistipes sp. ZOR0009 TaxID=1339253 RepID=UPI0006471529|nr:glutamate--tRNA ligase [Alistipes sp. ZOR0009]